MKEEGIGSYLLSHVAYTTHPLVLQVSPRRSCHSSQVAVIGGRGNEMKENEKKMKMKRKENERIEGKGKEVKGKDRY